MLKSQLSLPHIEDNVSFKCEGGRLSFSSTLSIVFTVYMFLFFVYLFLSTVFCSCFCHLFLFLLSIFYLMSYFLKFQLFK